MLKLFILHINKEMTLKTFSLVLMMCFISLTHAHASIQVEQFKNADHVLTFEVLTDDLIHFDYSILAKAPKPDRALQTTPIILKQQFPGANSYQKTPASIETSSALVAVDPAQLCFTIIDKRSKEILTRACPSLQANGMALTLDAVKTQNLYGLGEQFQTPGVVNGDWSGKMRVPGNVYGNTMTHFEGGNTGNAQFPILYALGPDTLNYALYLDTVYPLKWDFTSSPWKIEQTRAGTDPSFRGYVFLGKDLPSLRTAYMGLVGHPLVPPKKAFGLWVSEFGYRNWAEIEDKIRTLRKNHFPIDGFVLDLYWFGQYHEDDVMSAMGTLTWDTKNFPAPANRIAQFKNDDGVGIMTIEESYVSSGLKNYAGMNAHHYFVGQDSGTHEPMVFHAWWGRGSGIDWSQPEAGALWHNALRKKQLTDLGVTFHWTDLGEPEAWDDHDYYGNTQSVGHTEADAHNLYNFYWDQSIHDGYVNNHETERHFIMSRSGSPGIQRFGAAMWSGDIGSNLKSLAGHLNAQMNMSLSGIDYFGADIGGFNRLALEGDMGEVYTRWLANASLFDVPMRPHTDDGSKQNYTSPDRIGDIMSNRANLRSRYELAPYYYSLAYEAFRTGAPMVPPLVYYYQADQNVRQIADEKMIGQDLLGVTSVIAGEQFRNVYLPAGDWFDYRTLKFYHSRGETFNNVALFNKNLLQLPVFARAGAIIPKMLVDDQTMNVLGKRTDGTFTNDLRVRAFAGTQATQFKLVEDDGTTESYQGGQFAETLLEQAANSGTHTVTLGATQGSYAGMPTKRKNFLEFVPPSGAQIHFVRLNGTNLTEYSSAQQFDRSNSGWMMGSDHVVRAKSAPIDLKSVKKFEFY